MKTVTRHRVPGKPGFCKENTTGAVPMEVPTKRHRVTDHMIVTFFRDENGQMAQRSRPREPQRIPKKTPLFP